jgi:hypothetical protein
VKGVFRCNPLFEENRAGGLKGRFINRINLATKYVRINRQELKRSVSSLTNVDEVQMNSEKLRDVFNDLLYLMDKDDPNETARPGKVCPEIVDKRHKRIRLSLVPGSPISNQILQIP